MSGDDDGWRPHPLDLAEALGPSPLGDMDTMSERTVMRIAFAADHAGAALKDALLARLASLGPEYELIDLGGHGEDPTDDYPDYAKAVGHAIRSGRAERAILVCGSGVGAAVAASKMRGIRAAICHDSYSARQGVEHDDLNVLVLGGRVIGPELALECALAFLRARFSGEERHRRRLSKIAAIEAEELEASRRGAPPPALEGWGAPKAASRGPTPDP